VSLDEFTFGGRSVDQIARAAERPRDPYTQDVDSIGFRLRHEFGVGLGGPRSHMLITGLTDGGPRWWEVYPRTRDGRPPLWTRHMLGVAELERDRRLHPR
jgi:hypothetical protein